MDKYEYKVKTEQMLGYVERKQYQKAMEIADTIDWRRVKSASMLSSVSEIYEYNGENGKSRDILLVAFDRSPGSRKIIYRLGTLALKLNDIEEASDCYEEFVKLAPRDPNQYILKYKILKAQEAPLTDQISALEDFKKAEYIEKWAYELAKLYHEAGMTSECLEECDDLILWFSEGKYVYKAMELKMKYKPLTPLQQQKYDNRPGAPKKAPVQEPPKEIPKAKTSPLSQIEKAEAPKAANLREVISEVEKDETISMTPPVAPTVAPEKEEPEERHSAITNVVTGSSLQEAVRAGMAIASGINIEEKAMKEKDEELRVNGQMMIDEILQEWEEKQKENAEAIEKQKEEDQERLSKERADAERRLEEERLEVERKAAEAEEARKLAEEEEAARKAAEEEAAKKAAEEEAAKKAEEEEARRIASEEIANLALEAGVLSEEEIKEKFLQEEPQEISEEELHQLMAELDEEPETKEEIDAEEIASDETEDREASLEATKIISVDDKLLADLDSEEDLEEEDFEEEDLQEEDFEEADFDEEDLQEEDFEEADFEEEDFEEEDLEEADFDDEDFEEEAEETILEDFREIEPEEEDEEPALEVEDYKEDLEEESLHNDLEEVEEEDFEEDFEEEELQEEDFEEADFEEEDFEDADFEEDFQEENLEDADLEEENPEAEILEEEIPETEFEVEEVEEAEEKAENADLEIPDLENEIEEIDEFREFDDIGFDDDFEDDFDADFEDDFEDDDFEEDELEEEDFEEGDLETEEPEEEEKISLEDLEIEEPSEEEIQERIKKSKGSGVPFDTGFVVTGRYDLSATSEIGLKAGLTEDQKKLFSYFVPVRGMSEQLVTVLDNDRRAQREGTSKTGNLIIAGRKGSGKTVLAVDIVKAIQKQRNLKQGKVAIVTGDSLNKKELTNIIQKLRGGAIIIEKAGKLNSRTIKELNYLMEKKTGELLFVLEDQRKPLERIMTAHPDFRKKFTSKLELPVFINDELVTFGQTYAKENGYKLDEMGILALYSRIDVMQREDHSVSVAEVKDIMDEAIEHSQKATAKHLARRVFGKGTDDSDRIILKEEDFKI